MTSLALNSRSRSLGIKFVIVGLLALLMTIPAWLVDNLVEDRSRRADEVSQSIGSVSGVPQSFLGPVLAVPYTSLAEDGSKGTDRGVYVIFPAQGEAKLVTQSEVRHRSLFKVAVDAATVEFKASFDLESSPMNLPQHAELDWSRAGFITGASDSRGALADPIFTTGGINTTMGLSGILSRLPLHVPEHPGIGLKLFGLRAGAGVRPGSKFDLNATMKFSGSRSLTVLPFAKTSVIQVNGDWPAPGFRGGFLPTTQTNGPTGFQARWSIPMIARGVASEGLSDLITNLLPIAPVVDFVQVADPYQSVTRSVKYAILFLCLVFSTFFIFETTTGKRVHPAQYLLIGAAQVIFYLLLLSLAERIGFGPAFLIASLSTVSLISINTMWIFASRAQGIRGFMVFSSIYGLIYVLLTLDDQALLVGSVASFLATAAIMYFTRSIHWYADHTPESAGSPT